MKDFLKDIKKFKCGVCNTILYSKSGVLFHCFCGSCNFDLDDLSEIYLYVDDKFSIQITHQYIFCSKNQSYLFKVKNHFESLEQCIQAVTVKYNKLIIIS